MPNLTVGFENYYAENRLEGKTVLIALWDTAYVPLFILHIFKF